jgi:hypothetical protein
MRFTVFFNNGKTTRALAAIAKQHGTYSASVIVLLISVSMQNETISIYNFDTECLIY